MHNIYTFPAVFAQSTYENILKVKLITNLDGMSYISYKTNKHVAYSADIF